jgi:hypothetical protein
MSSNFLKIVDCRVFTFNRAAHCGFNGGIIEKSSGHFLTALFVDPIFSPATGQFFHLYTTIRGLPTSYTATGVLPSSMRFKWS